MSLKVPAFYNCSYIVSLVIKFTIFRTSSFIYAVINQRTAAVHTDIMNGLGGGGGVFPPSL